MVFKNTALCRGGRRKTAAVFSHHSPFDSFSATQDFGPVHLVVTSESLPCLPESEDPSGELMKLEFASSISS